MNDIWPVENLCGIMRQELRTYEFNSLHDVKQKIRGGPLTLI